MSDTYNLDSRPRCWEPGTQCPDSCASDHYRRVVNNHVALTGPWAGWRLAGRDLVAPSGERIPERSNAADLRDATRKRNAARKARQQSMVKVVVVDRANGENATSERGLCNAVNAGATPLHPLFASVMDGVVIGTGKSKRAPSSCCVVNSISLPLSTLAGVARTRSADRRSCSATTTASANRSNVRALCRTTCRNFTLHLGKPSA